MSAPVPIRTLLVPTCGRGRIVTFKAYFDDSGKSNDPREWIVSAGGCLGSETAWTEFEAVWPAALTRGGIEVFHGNNLLHDYQGSDLPGFIDELVGIFAHLGLVPFGSTIVLRSYRAVVPVSDQEAFGDALSLCWQDCLRNLFIHCAPMPPGELAQVFFANTPGMNGRIADMYEAFGVAFRASPIFGPLNTSGFPAKIRPLQAADFVAYASSKMMKTVLDDPTHWTQRAFDGLNALPAAYFDWITETRLREGGF